LAIGAIGTAWVAVVVAPERAAAQPPQSQSLTGLSGKQVFRFDTFRNEPFWSGQLKLHEVIEKQVDPMTALGVGLKVDAAALPPKFLATANLTDPATTVELLRRDAVVGLKAKVVKDAATGKRRIKELGVTCAICHSTADDSVDDGIGMRLDGWPNLDLNVGAILGLSPSLSDPGWGPGKYDPYFNQDGMSIPVVLPPAYGLQNVPLETFLGVGPISYWNAYVAVTQMHGQGTFVEPALGINIQNQPDLVTQKLPLLLKYQLSLPKPAPPAGFFDPAAAARGQEVFQDRCARCHIPPTYTDAPLLHAITEHPSNAAYATRPASITQKWRTTPLRALWQHPPYFHDGSAATLGDVIDRYDAFFKDMNLNDSQKSDLEEFLKSL
jgi:mono/diheme cytochrome c family protein